MAKTTTETGNPDDKNDTGGTATALLKTDPYERIPDFEIEFANDKNRTVLFQPTMEKMRPAWQRQNLNGDELSESLSEMPDFPGLRIAFSAKDAKATIYDPFILEEYRPVLLKAQAVAKKYWGFEYGPTKATPYDNLDTNTIKTWLYWLARLHEGKHLKILRGTILASVAVKRLPGKIRAAVWDSSAHTFKYHEDAPAFWEKILSGGR